MGVGAVSQLHSVQWVHGAGTLSITQLTDLSPGTNTQVMTERAAGNYHPQFAAVVEQSPEIRFATPQLQSLFLNLSGFNRGFSTCAGASDLHYKALTAHSVASSTGERIRLTQGMLYWQEITAAHNRDASITCTIVPTWDGTNNPLVSSSQSTAGTSTAAEHFGLGPIYLNGSIVDGVIDVSISSGAAILKKGVDSEPWPRVCYLVANAPMIRITTHAHARWTTHGLAPTEISSGSGGLDVYFRMKDDNGVNLSAASTVHPRVEMASGLLYVDGSSGRGNEGPVVTLVAVGANASTDVLTLSSGVALP